MRGQPHSSYFKPAGVPVRELAEIILTSAEFEALRLKDEQKLDQQVCAQHMDISQPTFHRLLQTARTKIAQAIVGGKAIRIEEKTSA